MTSAWIPCVFGIILGVCAQEEPSLYSLRTHPANLGISLDTALIRRLEPYESARAANFVGWAPEGMLIAMRAGDLPQLFQIPVPGATPRLISYFTDRVDRFHANPDPQAKLVLLTRDSGGNENFRLALYRWDTGAETPWPAPPGRVTETLWSRDGKCFAYVHNLPGRADHDIRLGLLPNQDRRVLRHPGAWAPLDFSPDNRFLLLLNDISASVGELWLLSLADSGLSRVLPQESAQAYGGAFFLNPEKGQPVVAFLSDRGGEFQRLYRYRFGDPAPEPLSPAARGDVEWAMPKPDRKQAIYSVNEEGVSRLYRLKLTGRQPPSPVPGIPEGVVRPGAYRPGSPAAAVLFAGPSTPGDVLGVEEAPAKAWAMADFGALPKRELTGAREFRFAAFDSAQVKPRKIPAWILLPPKPWNAPYPVLIQIHGGPELQARPGYDPFLFFCSRELGLAVIQPNVRGSTGYGKTYQQLDDGRGREGAVRDIGALLDAIGKDFGLDRNKVAVMGRSYGGFMALSALARFGDHLRAGISAVGISHFPSFLEGTAGYRRDLRRVEYGDERDPSMRAFLEAISPLNRASGIRTPLLLLHGRNDPRVPLSQSEKMFSALEKSPAETWLLVLEGEGHAARLKSRETLNHALEAQFLIKHLALGPRP